MPVTNDSFFTENIVNINKRIDTILFCAITVPVFFVLLTYVGVWYVPTAYALIIFAYTLAMSLICFFMNRKRTLRSSEVWASSEPVCFPQSSQRSG